MCYYGERLHCESAVFAQVGQLIEQGMVEKLSPVMAGFGVASPT